MYDADEITHPREGVPHLPGDRDAPLAVPTGDADREVVVATVHDEVVDHVARSSTQPSVAQLELVLRHYGRPGRLGPSRGGFHDDAA